MRFLGLNKSGSKFIRALRPIFPLILLAFSLRIFRLGAQGFWFDEAYSHFIAHMPLSEGLEAMVVDGVHPPLFNLIQKVALFLGESETAFRIPSVIFGVLAVVLIYLFVKQWFGERVALFAGLLLAISPFHLWYSQEARAYAMLAALALATMLVYERMLEDGNAWFRTLFVILSGLAYLTHYFALMLPLIQFAHLILNLRKRWRLLRIWTLLQFVAAIPLAIWIGVLAQDGERSFGIGWIPEPQLADLIYTLINFSVGYIQPLTVIQWLGFGVFLLLTMLGLRNVRLNAEKRSFLLLWAFLPMMVTFLLSLRQPTYVDRFFILSLPAWLLLAGLGLDFLGGWRSVAACVVVTAICVVGMVHFNFGPSQQKEAWREAAMYIEQANQEEVIVVRVLQSIVPLSYYYGSEHSIQAMEVNREITPLASIAEGHSGLWLIYWNAIGDAHLVAADPPFDASAERDPEASNWLAGRGPELVERFDMRGVTIFHFAMEP